MWRKAYSIEWAQKDDFICIKAAWQKGSPYILPPFGNRDGVGKILDKLMDYFQQNQWPFLMKGVTADMVAAIERERPGLFCFQPDRNNFDYVYLVQDMVELKGRKYSKKNNHINYFKRNYQPYRYMTITADLIPACKEMALAWYDTHNGEKEESLQFELQAIHDVLDHYDYLGVQGGVIVIQDKLEGFTFGEPLNEDTAVVHIEKGSGLRGIYQVINQEFCANAWPHMKYVNREEDMGIEGLRQAKESYYPVKMTEKYTATLKAEV